MQPTYFSKNLLINWNKFAFLIITWFSITIILTSQDFLKVFF